ncbi:MAG: VPLPA-CTERM sorting domain-containing protein [Methylococcaceae bacterium]|nr:VPLPA-CTERM sorting domain-containing protein [Methylococcaceae bacterium]
MNPNKKNSQKRFITLTFVFAVSIATLTPASNAAILNASLGGTFTMNLDRNALALATGGNPGNPGHFLVNYYDTAESDYTTRSDSSFYFNNPLRTEVSALNLVHDITPISPTNPSGQSPGRYVKATTPDFAVDSDSLTATGSVGMSGIELYKGLYNGALIYGDYSLTYNPAYRQLVYDDFGLANYPSGWYLQNNVSFSVVVYELSNLNLIFTDANNWQLSGDLLYSPENAGLLKTAIQADAGDFCLGFGTYSGCGQVSAVPLPAAIWLFISGLAGFGVNACRRKRRS